MQKKVCACLLILCFSVSVFCCFSIPMSAKTEKVTVKRSIAIVYDNSNSMFANEGNYSWCQAQYAMEIFASMMNDGDNVSIYPMWPVSVGNATKQYSYQKNEPYIVQTDSQKSDIKNLCTDHSTGNVTPIESLDAAYNGLVKTSGEKWLIVITDGASFFENGKKLSISDTKTALEKRFTNFAKNVNVLYLGIGESIDAPECNSLYYTYYAKTVSSEKIPSALTEMCNMIFGRDTLPESNYTTSTVTFDIPLSKLIVFVQGEDIENVVLKSNNQTLSYTKSFQPKYGTQGRKKGEFYVDKTLQGFIAVYSDLEAGTYSYTYSGKLSSIAFYYEPDADLFVSLTDKDGNDVSDQELIDAGTYQVSYRLVDDEGKELKSKLLGNTDYEIHYTSNGEEKTAEKNAAGSYDVDLKQGTIFSIQEGNVEFLNGYKISKEFTQLRGNLSTGIRVRKDAASDFAVELSGGNDTYNFDTVQDEGVYQATVTYEGKQLEGADLDNVTFKADVLSQDGNVTCTGIKNETGYEICLVTPDDPSETVAGKYTVRVTATYATDFIEETTEQDTSDFTVNSVSDKLTIKLVDPPAEYATTTAKNEKGFRAEIYYDGQPLTEEQMNALTLTVEAEEGLTLKATRIEGESAYLITPDASAEMKHGNYIMQFNVTGLTDRFGHPISDETTHNVAVHYLPLWVRLLLHVLVIVLIILYLISNVLPKTIIVTDVVAKINSKSVNMNGVSIRKNPNKATKKGTMNVQISIPTVNQQVGFKLTLIPKKGSRRITPSKKRKALFTSITPVGASSLKWIDCGGSFDVSGGKLIEAGKELNGKLSKPRQLPGTFSFGGTKIDGSGAKINYTVSGSFKIK